MDFLSLSLSLHCVSLSTFFLILFFPLSSEENIIYKRELLEGTSSFLFGDTMKTFTHTQMHTHTPKSSAADKRASLSKYLEACVCVPVDGCCSTDGNKGWEGMYWGGWWEASLCRLGQIVFPIKKRRTLSSFSLFFVPVREIGFQGQLWERDRRVCGCESKASFICILKRRPKSLLFSQFEPCTF